MPDHETVQPAFERDSALEQKNRELEQRIKELSTELRDANRLKSEFLANMSHELRTPLNAILGYSSLLLETVYGALNEKQINALDKITSNARDLLELINDILDLSRIEAGKTVVRLEPFKLKGFIADLVGNIDPLISRKSLSFNLRYETPVDRIHSDRIRLKQILMNLMSNAIKFTHEGSITLTVRSVNGGARMAIDVTDTGVGLTEDEVRVVFERFRQIDGTATRRYEGTGLGLSITKKLVELLGGEILVRSRKGEGSTFSVLLPVQPVHRTSELDSAAAPAPARQEPQGTSPC